jgi:hypothetical protein
VGTSSCSSILRAGWGQHDRRVEEQYVHLQYDRIYWNTSLRLFHSTSMQSTIVNDIVGYDKQYENHVTNLYRLRSDRERVRMKAGREGGWERVRRGYRENMKWWRRCISEGVLQDYNLNIDRRWRCIQVDLADDRRWDRGIEVRD